MEETYSKWPEWQKVYVKIKILTPRGCLPLPGAIIYIKTCKIRVTFVISTPDNSILSLISKWNLSPKFVFYTVITFQFWISQSMDNLKLWISQSGFSVPNCNLHMFYYCLSQSVKFVSYTECNMALWRLFLCQIYYGKTSKLNIHWSFLHSLLNC